MPPASSTPTTPSTGGLEVTPHANDNQTTASVCERPMMSDRERKQRAEDESEIHQSLRICDDVPSDLPWPYPGA